ncbi:MAG: GGDEF domain-containing protein [Pseudomonadota bacterium]
MTRAIADELRGVVSGSEVAARWGGEEFMLLLPEVTLEDAFQRAETLRQNIAEMTVHYGEALLPRSTISAGVAVASGSSVTPQDLLRTADKLLYQAKAEGRNLVCKSDD